MKTIQTHTRIQSTILHTLKLTFSILILTPYPDRSEKCEDKSNSFWPVLLRLKRAFCKLWLKDSSYEWVRAASLLLKHQTMMIIISQPHESCLTCCPRSASDAASCRTRPRPPSTRRPSHSPPGRSICGDSGCDGRRSVNKMKYLS